MMRKNRTFMLLLSLTICFSISACSITINWSNPPATTPSISVPAETANPDTPSGEPPSPELRAAYIDPYRNLWCWSEDGTATQIAGSADVSDAVISPDGQLVAFTRTSPDWMHASIMVIGCDGSSEQELVSQNAFDAMSKPEMAISTVPLQLAWLPGTHTLAYNTRLTFEGPGLAPNEDLWYVDADTGSNTAVLSAGNGGYFYISPDGSKVAFVRADSIGLMNADTTGLMQNVFGYTGVPTYSEFQYHALPSWSTDSGYLRVAIPTSDPLAGPVQSITIYQVPADGTSSFVVGYFNVMPFSGVTFSPDLGKVAYLLTYGDPVDNIRTLRIANSDGSNDTQIVTGQLDFDGWNPDGVNIVYSTWSPSNTYITNASLETRNLAEQPIVKDIQWVDSSRFFYLYQNGMNWELRLGRLGDGSILVASMPYTTDGYMPSYSFTE
jgi:Tol biopolymer transport system component